MTTRVPHVGARATTWCGRMRTSVVELIGMHETIALGMCSIYARTFATISRGAPDCPARMMTQTFADDATHRSVAIRLKCEGR